MTLDEFEAIRLADLEGLYQAAAAERMAVSRATFGRILEAAHKKIAEVLVHGHALHIEGGPVSEVQPRTVHCPRCQHPSHAPPPGIRAPALPGACPHCRHNAPPTGAGVDPPPRDPSR